MQNEQFNSGEPREETVSQGGGVLVSVSGGDERSEPESAILNLCPATSFGAQGGGRAAGARGARPAAALPCLNTINCNEGLKADFQKLSPAHRRTAHALERNCWLLVEKYGIERIGFLTLTFARHILSYKDAQKYLHSLMTGVLKKRYGEYIIVMERMESGRIHYHLLVVLAQDIRTGFDFVAVKRKDYRSANHPLRSEWAFWRKTAPLYGFGRTELMPIESSAEGIAKYVGKYIAKHIGKRLPEDKGARLVRYSRGTNRVSTRFFWHTPGADLWRLKLGALCRMLNLNSDNYTESFQAWYGKNWIQTLGPIVESIKLRAYPNFRAMQLDYPEIQIPPPELWANPDFDPFTGPWENQHPEQARETLFAAWMTALNERSRRVKRPKVWRGVMPVLVEPPGSPTISKSSRQCVSWIEQTAKND